jgi:hypothetical protein
MKKLHCVFIQHIFVRSTETAGCCSICNALLKSTTFLWFGRKNVRRFFYEGRIPNLNCLLFTFAMLLLAEEPRARE